MLEFVLELFVHHNAIYNVENELGLGRILEIICIHMLPLILNLCKILIVLRNNLNKRH